MGQRARAKVNLDMRVGHKLDSLTPFKKGGRRWPKSWKGEQKGKLLDLKRSQEKGRSQKVWQRKPKGVPMAPFAAHVGVPLGALDRRWPRPGPGAGHPTPPENAFINFLAVLGAGGPQRPKQHQKNVGAGGPKS